ncbi:MAG: DUF2892 domain-containing protein [Phenylobacterium zucineum]|nr:MAG: DUF2892 domain-containing protein [Phenylobacterium zucineum]
MIKNVGSADKIIRIALAVVAAALGFVVGAGRVGGILLFVVAVVLLVTALVGFCPLYRLFGLSTNTSAQAK